MSAGVIFQEALRTLNRYSFPEVSGRDLLAALEAGRPGPLAFLYDAGVEAKLPRQTLLRRAAAIYLGFCAVNLCDDLTDAECTYLSDPFLSGPCTQAILHHVFFALLAEEHFPSVVLTAVVHDLIAAGGAQHTEMHTRQWSAPVFREVAAGIAGRPWSAYLRILWHGTTFADRAAVIGMHVGQATLLWEDISSGDARYATLPTAEKHEIVTWATTIIDTLRKENLRCMKTTLQVISTMLTREQENLTNLRRSPGDTQTTICVPLSGLMSHRPMQPLGGEGAAGDDARSETLTP